MPNKRSLFMFSSATDSGVPGNDMNEAWKGEIRPLLLEALAKFETENDVARHLKEAFEKKRHGTWHCIVGKSFGSCVAIQKGTHFCEQIGQFYVELWSSG